jgi:hypothetical protein
MARAGSVRMLDRMLRRTLVEATVAERDVDLEALGRVFPTVRVRVDARERDDRLDVRALESAWAFDRAIDRAVDAHGVIHVDGNTAEVRAVLTRAQRRIERTNDASACVAFARALDAHRALHDTSRPLVLADLDHALDTWQWTLRLDADASLAAQLAALLHDVERLETEADVRIEQHAADYRGFKEAHARGGAAIAERLVLGAGASAEVAARVAELVRRSETPSDDAEVRLVNDADALSFFSLNSPGYADYYGRERTIAKIAYTLARMSPRARAELAGIALRADVRALLAACPHA